MTTQALEALSADLESLRAGDASRILRVVGTKLEDARAHADRAITLALKSTRDGRPTIRRATASPSFQAALNRLDELHTWLAGPSSASLEGAIRDSRERFYRRAFELQAPIIPESLRIANPVVTLQNIRLMRAAAIHGYDPRRELEGPISTAKRSLSAAVARAGQRDATEADETAELNGWFARTTSALTQSVLTLLSDSVAYAEVEAGRDLIRPEFLEV